MPGFLGKALKAGASLAGKLASSGAKAGKAGAGGFGTASRAGGMAKGIFNRTKPKKSKLGMMGGIMGKRKRAIEPAEDLKAPNNMLGTRG